MAVAVTTLAGVDGLARPERAAQLLLDARARRHPLRAFPEDVRPQSNDEAYAIQDRVLAALGQIGGWKVGAKSPNAEPTCAPLCSAWLARSPAAFVPGAFRLNGIEVELAFTLARDLPPRGGAYAEGDVIDAIASMHAAVEIVDSRFANFRDVDAPSLLADSLSHGALVIGAHVPPRPALAMVEQSVELRVDERRLTLAKGSNPAGSPYRLIAWLANHAASRYGGLRKNQIVTTGSWTGMQFVAAGGRVSGCFPGIGDVMVSL